jgi:hypothetical protein
LSTSKHDTARCEFGRTARRKRAVRGRVREGRRPAPLGRARGEGPALAGVVQAREPSPRTKRCGQVVNPHSATVSNWPSLSRSCPPLRKIKACHSRSSTATNILRPKDVRPSANSPRTHINYPSRGQYASSFSIRTGRAGPPIRDRVASSASILRTLPAGRRQKFFIGVPHRRPQP